MISMLPPDFACIAIFSRARADILTLHHGNRQFSVMAFWIALARLRRAIRAQHADTPAVKVHGCMHVLVRLVRAQQIASRVHQYDDSMACGSGTHFLK